MGLLSPDGPMFGSNPEVSGTDPKLAPAFKDALRMESVRFYVSFGLFFLDDIPSLIHPMDQYFKSMKVPTQTLFTNSFYLAHPDHDFDEVITNITKNERPLVIIGPPHVKHISCAWFPTRIAFIPAIPPGLSAKCSGEQPLIEAVLAASARFPKQTVIFLSAVGPWGKVVLARAALEMEELHKDVFLDLGSTMDAIGGHPSRDYDRNPASNCQAFGKAMTCSTCHRVCTNKTICDGCESEPKDDCMASRRPASAALLERPARRSLRGWHAPPGFSLTLEDELLT